VFTINNRVRVAVAGLASIGVLLAGCSSTPAATPPVAEPATEPVSDIAPSTAPGLAPVSGPVDATIVPKGWKLSDIPTFPPRPVAKPITVPDGAAAPFLYRIDTDQPVAFITIDDGGVKHPEAVKLLAAANVPVTLFLTTDMIKDDVEYFRELQQHGAVIEAHTITHPMLRGRSADFQKKQICGSADKLGQWYGRRPTLFRPPFGEKDHTTLTMAHRCGIKAAFYWKETVHKGKVRYQEGNSVKRGDIILMHFRPAFPKDFIGALKAIHAAGLTPALLEDYIPQAG
jgi:peptidoglycan/xylan/chitin deacetylase (PgdA/CDA1 family)